MHERVCCFGIAASIGHSTLAPPFGHWQQVAGCIGGSIGSPRFRHASTRDTASDFPTAECKADLSAHTASLWATTGFFLAIRAPAAAGLA